MSPCLMCGVEKKDVDKLLKKHRMFVDNVNYVRSQLDEKFSKVKSVKDKLSYLAETERSSPNYDKILSALADISELFVFREKAIKLSEMINNTMLEDPYYIRLVDNRPFDQIQVENPITNFSPYGNNIETDAFFANNGPFDQIQVENPITNFSPYGNNIKTEAYIANEDINKQLNNANNYQIKPQQKRVKIIKQVVPIHQQQTPALQQYNNGYPIYQEQIIQQVHKPLKVKNYQVPNYLKVRHVVNNGLPNYNIQPSYPNDYNNYFAHGNYQ